MAKQKNSGLGRGLDSLFYESAPKEEEKSPLTTLKISEVAPRAGQPRKDFDPEGLAELSASIARHGLIQPIIVRAVDGGFYEIIAGERRWRASKMAGLTEIPVIIIEADNQKTAELSIIENVQRRDLNPIEEAMAYKELIDRYGMTQEELASQMSKSRSAIANTLRLLDLPDVILAMVKKGELSAGHARTLLPLKDSELMEQTALTVIEKQLSVRETEALVKRILSGKERKDGGEEQSRVRTVDYKAELEKKIRVKMGRPVHIKDKGRVKKLELEYTDNNDLEQLLTLICGESIFSD